MQQRHGRQWGGEIIETRTWDLSLYGCHALGSIRQGGIGERAGIVVEQCSASGSMIGPNTPTAGWDWESTAAANPPLWRGSQQLWEALQPSDGSSGSRADLLLLGRLWGVIPRLLAPVEFVSVQPGELWPGFGSILLFHIVPLVEIWSELSWCYVPLGLREFHREELPLVVIDLIPFFTRFQH